MNSDNTVEYVASIEKLSDFLDLHRKIHLDWKLKNGGFLWNLNLL